MHPKTKLAMIGSMSPLLPMLITFKLWMTTSNNLFGIITFALILTSLTFFAVYEFKTRKEI